MKIAILGSTKGTDLQAIIDTHLDNRKNAYILERAKKHNIQAIYLEPRGK